MTNESSTLPNIYHLNKKHNSLHQRELNCLPLQPRPPGTISNEKMTNESSTLPNNSLPLPPHNSLHQRELNCNSLPLQPHNSLHQRELNCLPLQPRPPGTISNESIEHNTTDFGSRILHRVNKPDSLTEIPSNQNQNKRKYSEFPFPAATPTFPNNVDKKIISHSPKNTTPSTAKRSSSNRCPNQPNKITEYFMRYKQ